MQDSITPVSREPLLGGRITPDDEIKWILRVCHLLGWKYTDAPGRINRLLELIRTNFVHDLSLLIPYYTIQKYMNSGLIPKGQSQPEHISNSALANAIAFEYQQFVRGQWDNDIDLRAESRLLIYQILHLEWPGHLNKSQTIRRLLAKI